MTAAIGQAAHDTLVAMYPSQKAHCDEVLAAELAKIPDGRAKTDGIRVGQRAARAILALRTSDGSDHKEPLLGTDFITSDRPGKWRQDPISQLPIALGAHWGEVDALRRSGRDPLPRSPAAGDEQPPVRRSVQRGQTPRRRWREDTDQTDGGSDECRTLLGLRRHAKPLCPAAPLQSDRAADRRSDGHRHRRSGAAAGARQRRDGGCRVASWESKYYYQFWRPVTGIREADPGTGPTGRGDGNPLTIGDRKFSPLGAPASNLQGPNFTPPFPAYPSGHAVFGGALFQTLRNFYGTDDIPFTFVSDELNGVTEDNEGNVRPLLPRTFTNAVPGGGRKRPEPNLPRHPLGVRQDRGHRAGTAHRELRLRKRVQEALT